MHTYTRGEISYKRTAVGARSHLWASGRRSASVEKQLPGARSHHCGKVSFAAPLRAPRQQHLRRSLPLPLQTPNKECEKPCHRAGKCVFLCRAKEGIYATLPSPNKERRRLHTRILSGAQPSGVGGAGFPEGHQGHPYISAPRCRCWGSPPVLTRS